MSLKPTLIESSLPASFDSYAQAKQTQENLIWAQLDKISVEDAFFNWLSTLSEKTRINYQSGFIKLVEKGLIDPTLSLQNFSLINHEAILDRVKLLYEWSEYTRQARAACYISFTGYLNRRLHGIVKKALPNKEGNAKTFFKVREKVKTSAMTLSQWLIFFKALDQINERDSLMGKVILQGGKRVNEVLTLKISQISWEKCEITFIQSKMKGIYKETVITYPKSIIEALYKYVGDRDGIVFVTKFGRPVKLTQLARNFAKAGTIAGIPFKVTPHVLRASTVTYLKQQGFPDSDIMKVTGHASAEMVYAYDKSSRGDNASKKVSLIS